jgi:hypothetical protein
VDVLLDEIRIDGSRRDGRVHVEFGNVHMNIDPESARKIAFGLMSQSARAEDEAE